MTKITSAKVLLLDDDQDLRELMEDYFRPRGYEFISHSSGELGINEIIRQSSSTAPIDLVITDFRLPNMNGIELIERLKKVTPQIPIILVTAHSSLDLAIEAIDKGAYDFVVKPIQFAQLSISMERAIYFGRLRRENERLKSVLEDASPKANRIIAKSRAMKSILDIATRVARSDATILISGESGTGKEVIAQFIHNSSKRAEKPFIAINCSAIPEALLESELFGHAKGSFTGADEKKVGLFEEANQGTLFLDEIGDLSLPLQAKLLRVIQERKIKRVGENQYRDIDVRLLAATHKSLSEEVAAKRFREDLFFRLNVIPIFLPPLRDRKEDILPLADHFLKSYVRRNSAKVGGFSRGALEFLLKNHWKGNVRELENAIERAVVLSESALVEVSDLDFHIPAPALDGSSKVAAEVDEVEAIAKILDDDEKTRLAVSPPSEVSPREFKDSSPPPELVEGADRRGLAPSVHLLSVGEFVPMATLELRYIKYVLSQVNSVKDRAAKILQMDRKTLYRKLESVEKQTEGVTE